MKDFVGAHISISGGIYKAIDRALEAGCGVAQIFTRNSNQWQGKSISSEDAKLFRDKFAASGLHEIVSHDSYLINLASPPGDIRDKSIKSFSDELKNCALLGIKKVVMHPGSHLNDPPEVGLKRIVEAFDYLFETSAEFDGKVLLETTAGQGSNLGRYFEELQYIIENSKFSDRFGICFDTCHVYAAGYNIATKDGYEETITELQKTVGIDKLLCFHLNDSKKGLASRVDRHEHIGEGTIGMVAFSSIMNDSRFTEVPKIIETPKGTSEDMDVINMGKLRGLIH